MVVVDGCWLLLALTSAYYFLATLYKRVAPQEARQLPRGGGICGYSAGRAGTQEPWVAADARQLPRGGGICRYSACRAGTQERRVAANARQAGGSVVMALAGRGPKNPGWRPTPGTSPVAGGSVVMAFAGRRPKDSPHVSEAVAPEAWGHGTPHRNPSSPYRPAAPLARLRTVSVFVCDVAPHRARQR